MARVGIFGAGWVGLVTGTCLAELGHEVVVRDVVADKVAALNRGEVPFHEDRLPELLERNRGRMRFTERPDELVGCAFLFVCVDTPPTVSGDADLSRVWRVIEELPEADGHRVLVMKSTVPVGTGEKVRHRLDQLELSDIGYVSNPEFLAEGTAVRDFMEPDRIAIGAYDEADGDAVASLYDPLEARIVRCDVKSAEMIKLAANAALMTRISFINEIANVCEATGADVVKVAEGVGLDHRLGPHFLRAGIGYGGSCLEGSETVLVRLGRRTWLSSLERLFEELRDRPAQALEVLAWSRERGAAFLPVAAVTRRAYEGELVELETALGRRVSCTPDHPFVTARGTRLAQELHAGDLLPLALGAAPHLAAAPGRQAVLAGVVGSNPPGPARAVAPERRGEAAVAAQTELVDVEHGTSRRSLPVLVRLRASVLATLRRGAPAQPGRRAAREQGVPDAVWSGSEAERRDYLAELWRRQGSWSWLVAESTVVLELQTASALLADGVLRLLGEVGIVGRLGHGQGRRARDGIARIVVAGGEQVERLAELVGVSDGGRLAQARVQGANLGEPGYRLGDGAAWVRVASLERRPYRGFVYSLEVPGPHTFVTTAGLVVHNCFPKDSLALKQLASNSGYHFQLLAAVIEVNELQKRRVIGKLERHLGSLRGRKVALLGLAFKPGTDDMREAPSIVLAERLLAEGAEVRGWDPVADGTRLRGVIVAETVAEAVAGADAAVIVTEWPELAGLVSAEIRDAMATPLIVDGRNLLDPVAARAAGFRYEGVGRPGSSTPVAESA